VTEGLIDRFPALGSVPVIGIVRGYPPESAEPAAAVALEEGIQLIEVTLDSPHALDVVKRLARRGSGAVVGVGTVTNAKQVAPAAEAGASFVVTPTFSEAVIDACVAPDLPVISGAATPTEILNALEAGASAVKVFPAEQLGGPSFLRAVRAPLGNPPLIPTGGITPENAVEYLQSGALAVGAGSSLFPEEIGQTSDWNALRRLVRQWMEAIA